MSAAHAVTVFRKEIRDNFRDRRTLISTFSFALLGPALFIGLMTFILNQALGESEDPVAITVVGQEHAPSLIDFLKRQNTELVFKDLEDPEGAVRDGDESLVLVIPNDYAAQFERGTTVSLGLIYDSSDLGAARRKFSQTRRLLNQYSRTLGVLRLQLRGVAPEVVIPLTVREVDTASPAARALTILGMLPYLLMLAVFMGGFYLAIDTTAGERDHGTLEPLLTQPVSRTSLVLGKISATALFAGISVLLFLTSLYLALPFVPFHKVGLALDFHLAKVVICLLVVVPLIFFAAAMLTVVGSFAKSYKEAQTYLAVVTLVPTLPLVGTQLADVDSTWWLMLIPSLSQANFVTDVISDEPFNLGFFAISVVATSVFAAGLAWIAIRLYRPERLLG